MKLTPEILAALDAWAQEEYDKSSPERQAEIDEQVKMIEEARKKNGGKWNMLG